MVVPAPEAPGRLGYKPQGALPGRAAWPASKLFQTHGPSPPTREFGNPSNLLQIQIFQRARASAVMAGVPEMMSEDAKFALGF
jgi:hypothetical protein